MADVQVKELTPELHDDLMRFFDFSAYADNPHWASCFCTFFLARNGDEHEAHTKAENRATRSTVIRSGAGNGLVAFRLGRAVGWCHAAPKSELPLLASWDPRNAAETKIAVEAHPRLVSEDDPQLWPRRNYHGPLSMYVRAGFRETTRNESSITVRRELV